MDFVLQNSKAATTTNITLSHLSHCLTGKWLMEGRILQPHGSTWPEVVTPVCSWTGTCPPLVVRPSRWDHQHIFHTKEPERLLCVCGQSIGSQRLFATQSEIFRRAETGIDTILVCHSMSNVSNEKFFLFFLSKTPRADSSRFDSTDLNRFIRSPLEEGMWNVPCKQKTLWWCLIPLEIYSLFCWW